MTSKKRIAIFASGSGSNAEQIIKHFAEKELFEVSLILSNKADAYVHERARKLNVPSTTFSRASFYDSEDVINILKENKVDAVILAGFLWLIPTYLIHSFPDNIINIHPALLPKYGGKGMYGHHVHQAVVDNKEKETGITIHLVNEAYDKGKILFQAKCPVDSADGPEEVAAKIHELEYTHFPKVIEEYLIS